MLSQRFSRGFHQVYETNYRFMYVFIPFGIKQTRYKKLVTFACTWRLLLAQ